MDLYDEKRQIAAQKTGVAPATAANFEFWQFYINQWTNLRYYTKFGQFSLKNLWDMDLYD